MRLKILVPYLFLFLSLVPAAAQGVLDFESTVYDFGQVLMSKGAVSCSFTAKNNSTAPVVIQSVSTSCGCTNAQWDHNAILPGKQTNIKVTYTNDEGPYPFDKTITVKFTGVSKPAILHVRGISRQTALPDSQMYGSVFDGQLGFMSKMFKVGNLEQGGSRGDQTTVANFSAAPITLSFTDVSEGLTLKVEPNPIPAKGHATVYYTITSLRDKWGWNDYIATPVINGRRSSSNVTVKAFTSDSFSSMTREEKARESRPVFEESTFSFGHQKKGAVISASFNCTNKGPKTFKVHKVDSDYKNIFFKAFPDIAPGSSASFEIVLDTKDMPKGEALVLVTLTTNSPIRPVVTLFLAGWID